MAIQTLNNGDTMSVIRDKINDNFQNVFPVGVILMWSGSVETIPIGWTICDGNNGTPNLEDRFIVGAGGTYSVGNTGGLSSVSLTEAQMPNHRHGISALYGETGSSSLSYSGREGAVTHYTGYTGGNSSHENRPPYYALCFIMFLGV